MFFNSRRSTVHATNAVDAAVTAAVALNVVEPMSTGVGGWETLLSGAATKPGPSQANHRIGNFADG